MRILTRHRRRRRPIGNPPDPVQTSRVRQQVRAALGGRLQPSLQIGSPNDAFEQEADHMADRIAGTTGILQRQADSDTGEEEQKKDMEAQSPESQSAEQDSGEADKSSPVEEKRPEETLQAKGAVADAAPPTVERAIWGRRGGGQPLPGAARRFFEPRFGASFSGVRVHADAEAARLNAALGARAFTVGNDIFFARGAFAPASPVGRHLLAHELTHVLQQRNGLQRLQRRVVPGRVSCHGQPATWPVFARMGVTDGPAAVSAIQAAANRAVALLDDAIGELEYGQREIRGGATPGWPTISDTVALSLRRQLRLNPDQRRVWTGRGAGTVDIAIRWYRNVRRILAGDWMRYNCWGPDCGSDEFAWTRDGEYRIRLCRGFWDGSLDVRAITLIHEASHVYYGTEDRGRGLGSAYCLEQFICDLSTLSVCEDCS